MRDIDSLLGSMQELDPLAPIQKEEGPQKPDALSVLENASSTQSISMEDPFGLDGMESMFYSATDRIGNVIMPGSDPFETAARSQSSWDKLANGLVKAGANFSSVVAGGTLGVGAGIAQGLINLSDEDETTGFWDGVIKNGFVDSLDSMNESLRQYMPNFKTQKEQEAGLGQSISTVNFWADDFANGISFTLGALATEAIYSTITAATLSAASPLQAAGTARLALQAARVFKGFKRNLSAAQKAAPFTRAELRTAVNIAAPINQTGKLTRQIFTGAGYEAAFEARTSYNEMVESTLHKMREENPGAEYTEKDIDQETMANMRSISNYQFVGNLALVSSSNFIMFGKTFQVPKIREFARMAKAGKIVKNEAGEWIQKPLSKFAKARLITKHATKGILSEGFMEEGGQGIMSRMAINHLNKSKTPEGLEEAYGLYGNLVNTISAAKGEKEFQKEILIGSIIGLFGNAVADPKSILKDNLFIKARQIWKDQNPKYAPFLEHIEKGKFNSFTKANVDFLAAEYSTNEEYIEGLLQNDMAAVKDAENASIFDYAYGRYMMGLDSAIEEDIKSIEKKTEEEFIEEFLKDKNISKEDAKKIQQKAVDKMRRQISEFQQNMKDSTSFFAGQSEDVQKGGAWLFFSHKESIERYDNVVQSLSEDFKSINSYVLKKFVDNTTVHNFQKMFPELNKAITDKTNEGRKEAKKKLKEGASEIDILNSEEFKAWKKTKEYKAWKKDLEQNPEIKKFRRLIKAQNKETGKSQTEQEVFDSLVEGIEARMDLEVAIKIDSSRQHDLQKIREAKNNLDDLIYLKNKKETIDQFIGKLVENPEGRNPEKETFIRDIDRNAEEVTAELAKGLQERAKTSKIEELTKKTSQVERIASERAGNKLEKEKGSQADFAKTFLSEIGELLRRAETGKAILEEEAAKAAEEAGESTATSNPPPVDPLSPDNPVFDPQEQELKDDETESENGSPRTAYQTLTDRLKFAGKHDDIFVTDENGNIVYENGEPLHKEEFRESNPDHQKNRDNDNDFRTYRAIFSIFKIINGEEDHYLVNEDGDSITSLSEMVLKTYGPNQGLEDKSWFESKAVKGKNPLVARLETTEGKPVKIKGKDVVFYMQEDTFTTKSVDEKGNTKVYTRFRFGKFFEKRGLPFTIADLGDLNTLDERIEKATEDDKHLYLLQKEQKKWKELREKLVKGEDPLEIPLTAIRINPGRSTGKNTKERTQVLDMFNGDIEFFEKAVEEKRVFLQAVKGGKGYKKKDGVGEATFSYTDKVLGGRIPGAPGQVHLIVDNQSWRVSKNPIGPKGRERIADIIRASVLALEARAKDKKAQGPMITYWEGGDTKYNQLNIGEYLRNIAGIVIPGPNNFTVIDGKAVLNAETIKKIEENNWVYLSNIWWSKEENKFKTFNKFESSWNFHYQDPKTGKYVTKSFSQIVKRPKKAKQDDPDTADVSGVSIDMEALEEILTGARYRITLPSEEDNMESQMEFITGYDPENKEFTTSKMSLGKWLLADGEPKIEIIGLPEPVSKEKPTIDDLITNGNILSTSMTAVMDLGDSVIEEPEAAEAAEARNSSDNSAVPGGINMGANTSPDSEDVLSGAIDPIGGSVADFEAMQAAIKAAQQNNSKLSNKDTEALDGLFRARPKNSPVSQIPKEEKEWFKKTFPFLETIYGDFDSGIDAMIKKGRVLLNKDARAGTLFHEAFHIFLRSQFKDQASLNAYLQKVKDRLGNRMIITQNGKSIWPVRASEATLLQIEEYLAEQYSAYRTVGEFYKFADTQTKNIFQKIWEALKRLFGIKNLSPMQEMFYSLDESGPINITREELESSIPNVLYRASVEELRALPLYHSLFFNSIESKQESEGEMYTSLEGLLEKNPGLFEEVEEKIIALQEAIALKTSPEEAKMYVENIKSITESYKKALAVIGIEEIEDFLETLQERDAVKDNQEYLDRSEKSSFSRAPKVLKIFLSHKFGLLELKRGSTILSNTLETSSSITEMRKRLADLIKNSNDSALTKSFQSILDSVLGNNLTPEMANVQRAFFSTFSQSKVEVAYVLVGDTASIVNSTLKQFTNSLKAAWVNNATSMLSIDPKSTMLDKEDGQIILNQKKFSELKLDDFENSPALVKEVFSKIGLPIEEKERLKDPKAFTIFLGHIADQVREFAAQKETVRLDSLFSEDGTNSKQLAGRLVPIMEVLRQTRPYDVELSSYNESGKKKHAVSLSTFVSKVAAFARQGSPVFDTPLRTKSRLYKAMKKNYFRVVEITGLDSTYSKSTALDKLDPQSQLYTRLEAQMNSLFVLPSDDRKTMRALDVRGTNYDAMSEEIFIERATEHLKIEMEEYLDYISRQTKFNNKEKNFSKGLFAFNKIDQKLGLSRQIGSSKNIERVLEKNKQEIRIYFKKELAFLKQDLSDLLEESGLLKIKRDKENKDKILEKTVLLNPTSFTNNFFGTKRKYNEKELQVGNTPQSKNFVVDSKKQPNTEAVFNAFLTYIAANDFLFALDSSITFSGGLFSYTSITQMYKRHARITSPQTNNANDPETMAYLERDFRRSKVGLNEKGQYKRSLLKVITVRNFLRKSPITGQEMDTTDGFTWMNYETYRDLRLKVGGRWNTADEILYQYNSQMLFREGIKRKHSSLFTPQKFNEIFKGHATYEDAVFPSYKEKPIKELRGRNSKKEDTGVYYLEDLKVSTEIEKPHGIGPAYYPDGSVVENHMMKTAVMPLTYLEHKNDPDIMEMALDMLSEGVDLIQTDSSNKGDKMLDANGNIPTLFKENESFGTFEYVKGAMKNSAQYMAEFPAELFTLQQDPSGDTGLVTTSIQLVSLVKSNILHKLTGEEKERMLKKSRMAEHIIDTIRSRSYDKMIKDLGVEAIKNSLTGEEYLGIPKKNWGKVKNMLLSAVNNSFTSESTKAAIENFLDKEKDLSGLEYLNLDMSSMGEKLSTILTSAMESRVIKLRGAGSQLVQVPNALYSRALEFYQQMSTFSSKHLENTTDYAEIMISFPTKAIPWLKKHFNGSVDELNNAMLNGQVPLHLMKELRLLTDINANRIPTSGMNLIDSFKVVKFLHWTSGKKVVLPDGMTEKGGSDYDIDKLTSYFYSFEMLDDTLVSFSVEDPSKKITQEDLYNYYALAKTNVNSAIKKLESSDSTVTPRQLDRIMEDPLIQKFIPSSSIEAIRFEEEYNTLSEEEKKILIAGETARILRVLKGIVFPKVTSIHEKGFTYGEILSNEYLLNGLQDIYREFITHAENYNALTTPLTMQIFQEAEDVQKLVEEDKKGKNRWKEDNLRGFSLRHSVNVKHRTSIATSDIGTTATALVVQGLLSSSDKKVRTQVKSIFRDFPGYYALGQQTLSNAGTALHLNSPAYTVVDVLNQLAQGELEIGSDPTVYYANVTGEMNSIFQAMIRLSPTSSQDMPLDYWINFITSPEVREVVKQAEKMSSEVIRIKDKGNHASFPAALVAMSKGRSFIRAFDTNPTKDPHFNKEEFEKALEAFEINLADLSEKSWREANPEKIAVILSFYYSMSSQLAEIDKQIYQDSGFPSGSSQLNLKVLEREKFTSDGRGSNLIWAKEDLDELNSSNRTGNVEKLSKRFNRLLSQLRMRGAHPLIHEKLNEMVKKLPRTKNKEKASASIERTFLAYIIHNELEDMAGYEYILSSSLMDKILEKKKRVTDKDLWNKIEVTSRRVDKKNRTKSLVKTAGLVAPVNDPNEINVLQAKMLRHPEVLKELAYLTMAKSGFAYEYQSLTPLLPDDYLMELYAPAYRSFLERVESMEDSDLEQYLARMEDTMFRQLKILKDESMSTTFDKVVSEAFKIGGIESQAYYALPARNYNLTAWVNTTGEYKGYGFNILPKVPSKHNIKDQQKADYSNALIAYAEDTYSSTSKYKNAALKKGVPINNTIVMKPGTVATVSVKGGGKASSEELKLTLEKAKQVLKYGGTIIMDSTHNANSSHNASGEGVIQKLLGEPTGKTKEGFNYWGPNPGAISDPAASFEDSNIAKLHRMKRVSKAEADFFLSPQESALLRDVDGWAVYSQVTPTGHAYQTNVFVAQEALGDPDFLPLREDSGMTITNLKQRVRQSEASNMTLKRTNQAPVAPGVFNTNDLSIKTPSVDFTPGDFAAPESFPIDIPSFLEDKYKNAPENQPDFTLDSFPTEAPQFDNIESPEGNYNFQEQVEHLNNKKIIGEVEDAEGNKIRRLKDGPIVYYEIKYKGKTTWEPLNCA